MSENEMEDPIVATMRRASDIVVADLRHCQLVVEQLREEILRHEAREQINKWQIDALTKENDKQAAEIERLKGEVKDARRKGMEQAAIMAGEHTLRYHYDNLNLNIRTKGCFAWIAAEIRQAIETDS